MKNYTKKELQSMSDWNLVQIYCDEMGGIDENDLMIEVRGNKEERENLISQLLQRMKSKYKDGGGVSKDKVFEVAYYGKKHLKQRGSSKGNYKTWVVAINREEAIEKVKNDDDEFAELKSAKPTNIDVERYKMKNGGGVGEWRKGQTIGYKTKKEAIYRLSLIKNHNKSDTEYRNLKVEKTPNTDRFNDKYVVSFEFLKKYKNGGGIDINELNMPVIRTQFEDEEYEFKDGGNVDSDIAKYKKQLIAKAKSKGLYENFGQKEIRVLEDKYGYNEKIKDFDNWASNFDLGQMAEGGTTKGFEYSIGGL